MKNRFLIKAAVSIAGLVAASVVSANATLTLNITSDGSSYGPLSDGGIGFVNVVNHQVGSWLISNDTATGPPINGTPGAPIISKGG